MWEGPPAWPPLAWVTGHGIWPHSGSSRVGQEKQGARGGRWALAGYRGGQGQSPRTLQFPCESTILLNRIMDFKMPRKAESAVRWAALLLLTTTSFSELREEINQTTLACNKQVPWKHSLPRNKHIYIINPKLKGNSTWG